MENLQTQESDQLMILNGKSLNQCSLKELTLVIVNSKFYGFNTYDLADWSWIANQIKKQFPNLTLGELDSLIMKGIRGTWGKHRYFTFKDLYDWLDHRERTPEEKKEIQDKKDKQIANNFLARL